MNNYFVHTFELSYRTTLDDILELTDHKLVKINGEYKSTKYTDRGLAKDRAFHYYSLDGEKKERAYLVWTSIGMELIRTII